MAASFGPYWMNAATFSETSGLWLSNLLTQCAPSGYYSNGVVIRYLDNTGGGGFSDCCLGPVLDCPYCAPPVMACGTTWPTNGGDHEIYETTVGAGSGVGVLLVGLNPADIPDGVAARFPAGIGGTIHSEGSSQMLGYGSCNYNGVSTNLWDHACYIGDIASIDTGWPGINTVPAQCSAVGWDCGGPEAPPVLEPGYQRKQWNDALEDWEDVPGAPLVDIEISNYNVGSQIGTTAGTQLEVLGLRPDGTCAVNDSLAACEGTTGMFWVPIYKSSPFDQQVEVNFVGSADGNTGYTFAFTCPMTPWGFSCSDLSTPILSTADPTITPACTDVPYPDVLYQISVWVGGLEGMSTAVNYDAATTAAITDGSATNVLGQNCFAYTTSTGSGLRINEGGTNFEWFKVNLNTGSSNANRCITIGVTGQDATWQQAAEWQAALVQIDTHGVITRIVQCTS